MEKVVALDKAGKTAKEIADKCEMSVEQVKKILEQHYKSEFIETWHRYPLRDDQYLSARNKLMVLAAKNHTLEEIGGWLGMTRAAVSIALRKAGFCKDEFKEEVDEVLMNKILELHNKGAFVKDIADQLDLSQAKVRKLLDTQGLKANRPPTRAKNADAREMKLQKILDRHRTGKYTLEALGKQFQMNPSYLGRRLEEIRDLNKKIRTLSKKGESPDDIAYELNLSPVTVRHVLSKS